MTPFLNDSTVSPDNYPLDWSAWIRSFVDNAYAIRPYGEQDRQATSYIHASTVSTQKIPPSTLFSALLSPTSPYSPSTSAEAKDLSPLWLGATCLAVLGGIALALRNRSVLRQVMMAMGHSEHPRGNAGVPKPRKSPIQDVPESPSGPDFTQSGHPPSSSRHLTLVPSLSNTEPLPERTILGTDQSELARFTRPHQSNDSVQLVSEKFGISLTGNPETDRVPPFLKTLGIMDDTPPFTVAYRRGKGDQHHLFTLNDRHTVSFTDGKDHLEIATQDDHGNTILARVDAIHDLALSNTDAYQSTPYVATVWEQTHEDITLNSLTFLSNPSKPIWLRYTSLLNAKGDVETILPEHDIFSEASNMSTDLSRTGYWRWNTETQQLQFPDGQSVSLHNAFATLNPHTGILTNDENCVIAAMTKLGDMPAHIRPGHLETPHATLTHARTRDYDAALSAFTRQTTLHFPELGLEMTSSSHAHQIHLSIPSSPSSTDGTRNRFTLFRGIDNTYAVTFPAVHHEPYRADGLMWNLTTNTWAQTPSSSSSVTDLNTVLTNGHVYLVFRESKDGALFFNVQRYGENDSSELLGDFVYDPKTGIQWNGRIPETLSEHLEVHGLFSTPDTASSSHLFRVVQATSEPHTIATGLPTQTKPPQTEPLSQAPRRFDILRS